MVFSYLDEKNIFTKYSAAKDYTDKLTEPFPEFERIAQNKPHENIDKDYPKTTDGTTASIIRKAPRRALQQLPTGVIKTDNTDDWRPIVAEFVFTNKIIPYANEEYDLMQKCWSATEKAMTFGSAVSLAPFVNHDGYFSPDMTIPYWGDIFIQPGKKSGYDCDYVFVRTWFQLEDIEALISREKKMAKEAKKNGEKYESSWDLAALEDIKTAATPKDEKAVNPTEEDRGIAPDGIELIIGYQEGVNAKFFTFNPKRQKIVRTKVNKDPRGKMPVDWLYADIDSNNPLGRSVVELIGGLQNLIDADMQMYQFNRALMLAPPIVKRGTFSKSKIVYKPNAIIDLGSDMNARIDPLNVDTTAVTNYPNLYGLQKSQLLNLISSPDSSISAEIGNPGFSKTHAGVEQQNQLVSIDDNYTRKMVEAWFENWGETVINLHFAEKSGIEELQLDTRTVGKLNKLIEKGIEVPNFDPETGIIMIDYDAPIDPMTFRIDASTSKVKSDSEQLEALSMLLERLEASPLLSQLIVQGNEDKIIGAWNSIVAASGVEDPELLSVDIEEWKEQQQQQQEQMMQQQAMEQEQAMGQQQLEANALPAEIVGEEEPAELTEDDALAAELTDMGFAPEVIAEAMQMADEGYTSDEILGALTGEPV